MRNTSRTYILMIAAALLLALAAGCDTTETSDYYGPRVYLTRPAPGEEGVALNETIAVTFNEELDILTITNLTFTVSEVGDAATPVAGTALGSGSTASFTPVAPFAPLTTYVAMLNTGIADQYGNYMEMPYWWYFITGP